MLYEEQTQILLCNLRTLSKLLSKSKPDVNEILCWLGPAAAQADLVDESISMLLYHAADGGNFKVIKRRICNVIKYYNNIFFPT